MKKLYLIKTCKILQSYFCDNNISRRYVRIS